MLFHHIECVDCWSFNPYNKCSHNCVYCIAHSQGKSTPRFSKGIISAEIENQITAIPNDKEIFVGAICDAYPQIEETLEITRESIRTISKLNRPFCINTKSDLVCRDIDILKSHKSHCDVYMSIFCLNDDTAKQFEPGAPSITRRLTAIKQLIKEGILVGIDASPWIPGISNISDLLNVIPNGVFIQVSPLEPEHFVSSFLNQKYSKEFILKSYLEEKERVGNLANVVWKMPIE